MRALARSAGITFARSSLMRRIALPASTRLPRRKSAAEILFRPAACTSTSLSRPVPHWTTGFGFTLTIVPGEPLDAASSSTAARQMRTSSPTKTACARPAKDRTRASSARSAPRSPSNRSPRPSFRFAPCRSRAIRPAAFRPARRAPRARSPRASRTRPAPRAFPSTFLACRSVRSESVRWKYIGPGVHPLDDSHDRDSRFGVAREDRAFDRRSAAMPRQQRCVHVHRRDARNVEDPSSAEFDRKPPPPGYRARTASSSLRNSRSEF